MADLLSVLCLPWITPHSSVSDDSVKPSLALELEDVSMVGSYNLNHTMYCIEESTLRHFS